MISGRTVFVFLFIPQRSEGAVHSLADVVYSMLGPLDGCFYLAGSVIDSDSDLD